MQHFISSSGEGICCVLDAIDVLESCSSYRWMQNRTMRMDGESYSKLEGMYGDSLAGTKDDSFEDHAPPRMGVSTGPSNI